jgi:hypothetical protein
MKVTAHTKEELIRKFIEKLDYSYNYKTVNERQSIINDICEIAGIEQLNIPFVVGQSEQILAWERWRDNKYAINKRSDFHRKRDIDSFLSQ